MKLEPKIAPGRTNRKARAFALEIARLTRGGYGCEAIREALGEAGVVVSKSTVQREMARTRRESVRTIRETPAPGAAVPSLASTASQTDASPATATERLSGKDLAEEFVKGRITNPLISRRTRDEDSRH